jgi:hypothetical protein
MNINEGNKPTTMYIKDYLHLYIGCNIQIGDDIEKLIGVNTGGSIETLFRGRLTNYYDSLEGS